MRKKNNQLNILLKSFKSWRDLYNYVVKNEKEIIELLPIKIKKMLMKSLLEDAAPGYKPDTIAHHVAIVPFRDFVLEYKLKKKHIAPLFDLVYIILTTKKLTLGEYIEETAKTNMGPYCYPKYKEFRQLIAENFKFESSLLDLYYFYRRTEIAPGYYLRLIKNYYKSNCHFSSTFQIIQILY